MNLVWVTSFANDMYKVSGKPLIDSFVTSRSAGRLFCITEGIAVPPAKDVVCMSLDTQGNEGMLPTFLRRFADKIPKALGGTNPGVCKCPGGPFSAHDKRHVAPCIAQWFCRNASRWFRKMASLQLVGETLHAQGIKDQVLVWIDADCRFARKVPELVVQSWFVDSAAVFYHKDSRPVLEAGVVGYWIDRGADKVLQWMFDCYMHGGWVGLQRWDDCYVLQKAMEKTPSVKCVDIACGIGDHAKVIDYGPVGPWIVHDKGRHGRKLGVMK